VVIAGIIGPDLGGALGGFGGGRTHASEYLLLAQAYHLVLGLICDHRSLNSASDNTIGKITKIKARILPSESIRRGSYERAHG
jgi:hypothetical protein